MVKPCGLSMISKLQCNAALWYPYKGGYSGHGPHRKYGDNVDYRNIPEKYLESKTIEDGVEERIYQIKVWHKDFHDLLNVTIIQRIRLKDRNSGYVVLFSDDLGLPHDKMILFYRLRFQTAFYLDLILKKNNPEISRSISFEELQMPIADIGCIHTYKKAG